jgi:hypothetical protein
VGRAIAQRSSGTLNRPLFQNGGFRCRSTHPTIYWLRLLTDTIKGGWTHQLKRDLLQSSEWGMCKILITSVGCVPRTINCSYCRLGTRKKEYARKTDELETRIRCVGRTLRLLRLLFTPYFPTPALSRDSFIRISSGNIPG